MNKKFMASVFNRLQYVILASLCAILYVSVPTTLSMIAIGVTGLYILLFEIYLFLSSRRIREVSNNIVSMLDMTSQKRLVDFPIPLVITDSAGKIIWYSENFIDQFGEEKLSRLESIDEIDRDILKKRVSEISYHNKYFSVFTDCSVLNDKEMFILYFFNTTEHHFLIKEYNLARPVVAYVLIDNYDEIFANSRENEKTQVMALIDEKVSRWTQRMNCIVRRIERDRYLLIFEYRNLLSMVDDQFGILDSIKEVKTEKKGFPTLSVGVGVKGNSFAENEDLARMAIDMALSRGGDQAVVKTANDYRFYGGSTSGLEKRTKVKARVIASAFKEILRTVDTVFVMGHQYSDMDCLGACVGISRIAKKIGKKVYIIIDRETTLAESLYRQLEESEEHQKMFLSEKVAENFLTDDSLLVITDTHRASMLPCPSLVSKVKNTVVIDHHRKSADYIEDTALFFHDPTASSSCEMVAELLQYMAADSLEKIEAESLLAGIFLDTKFFTIRTTSSTFEASSYLRSAGANPVNVRLLFQTDRSIYMEKVDLVKKAEIYRDIVAIAVWDGPKNKNLKMISSQAADDLLNIENICVAFTLFADESNGINISARSVGTVNVQIILERLGGGGHQTMAGAQLRDFSLEQAIVALKASVDKYLNEVNIKIRQ